MVDKIDKQRMAANYGFALAFMRSDDELWKLFNQAVKQTWTADRFVAKLRNTDWFQKHSSSVRNAILQETSDPASYSAAVDQMYSTVRDAWGSLFGTAQMDQKDLRAWAETAHRMGWSQSQLIDRMSQGVNYQKLLRSQEMGGSTAALDGQIQQLTSAYGLSMGDGWRARQIKRIVQGDDTIEGVQSRLRELAMREYKGFADAISGGQSVQDIAEPYIQRMADLLELNPAEVGVSDRLIQKALKMTTADGKPAGMDLGSFADLVRSDDRWQYTDNAREQMSSIVASIGQMFGQVA